MARPLFTRVLCGIALLGLLSGCKAVVLAPSGDIAAQQRDLLLISTGLLLLIVIPVMVLIVVFAWRYRQSNTAARYEPEWSHSTQLELLIWSAPLLIIICLGALTWTATHLLDPYRPLTRLSSDRPIDADVKPLQVQVVALDWKWLFIYPEYGVASVNQLAAPVDRPINFQITAANVMNSFYIPALAGQIYAMPAMETRLHAVINHPGDFEGFSANYSGAGFSGMHFRFLGLSGQDFDSWMDKAKASAGTLDRDTYIALAKPSENEPVHLFKSVSPDLYHAVLNMCVEPGRKCMDEIMRIDAQAGRDTVSRGAITGVGPGAVASICTAPRPGALLPVDRGVPALPRSLSQSEPAGAAPSDLLRLPVERTSAAAGTFKPIF